MPPDSTYGSIMKTWLATVKLSPRAPACQLREKAQLPAGTPMAVGREKRQGSSPARRAA